MAKAKKIANLSDLTPDTQNANKGTERGRYMVEASLTETGAGRSIVADKDGRIIAGNKTLEAWAGMGGAVKVIETDGNELVVVQRTDLDLSDPKGKARKLAYYDNRAGQVGLEWDAAQLLADVNAGVDLAAMFKADEIAELLAGAGGQGEADAEPQIDQAAELNKKWQVKPGDLWRIGAHRLLCGDSTKAADVARVMGGERAALAAVDPPYNVGFDYDGKTVDDSKSAEVYETFSRAWFAECRAVSERQIVTPGCYNLASWLRWLTPYHVAPWTKTAAMTNGKVSRFWCWEPVLFFGDKWNRARSNDVFHYEAIPQKMAGGESLTGIHPCPKPLPMWLDLVTNYSEKGETIYEAFGGSGTTLVACENLGRKCRAIEISPAYCAVILERIAQAFPKLEIQRDDAG